MIVAKQEMLVRFDRVFAAFGEEEEKKVCAVAEYKGKDITITGRAKPSDFSYGLTYRLFGRWVNHPRHGQQFNFDSAVLSEPLDERGVVRYMMHAPGIGKQTAERLWAVYGSKALEKLRTDPAGCSATIPRLSFEMASEAGQWLRDHQAVELATVELQSLLGGHGFGPASIKEALRVWGNRAPQLIRGNPYLVLRLPACGFAKADKLWKMLGKPLDRLKRQALCINYEMESSSEGHTWHHGNLAKFALDKNIDSGNVRLRKAVELGVRADLFEMRRDEAGVPWIAEKLKAVAELAVARRIKDLMAGPNRWPDVLELDQLSPHQRGQLKLSTSQPFGLLTGLPGSGKTVSLAAAIKAVVEQNSLTSVAVCAPTGRAAVRISEQMARVSIPLKAATIHRLLGINMADGDGWRFNYNAANPMPFDFLFVEEASMCDTTLLANLLVACAEGTQVMLIGDQNQLPPVGHGSPLRDLIESGRVPQGNLTETWRNSGRIVQACKEIYETSAFRPSRALQLPEENLLHVESKHATHQLATLDRLYDSLGRGGQFDPIWHFQVLCAVNTNSELSRKKLNDHLQAKLNPRTKTNSAHGNPFHVKDKIICRKNKWMPADDPNDIEAVDGKIYVANGEIGEVVKVTQTVTTAEFRDPYRVIRIPRAIASVDKKEEEDSPNDSAAKFELAYAISGHSSQGGQWPIVCTMVDESHGAARVCSKEWVFTALSRAQIASVTIGRWDTLCEFLKRTAIQNRKTFLKELLLNDSFAVV